MSAFTMGGRLGQSTNNGAGAGLNSTMTPTQHQNNIAYQNHQVPSQAPYPRNESGLGLANAHPGAVGHNYHLSPITPQQIQNNSTQQQRPAAAPLGAFNFTQIQPQVAASSAPQLQQQQYQSSAAATPAAPPQSADAMRDYVANLRAQVANLKTEVDGNPAAARRLSQSSQQQQNLPPQAPTPGFQPQLQVNAQPAPSVVRSAASTPHPGPTTAASIQRPNSASRTAASRLAGAAATTNMASSTRSATANAAGARSPASAGRTAATGGVTGRSSSVPRKGGKTTMAQRVMALREDLKAQEENVERLTAELEDIKNRYHSTSGELDTTKQVLLATDSSLRDLSARHSDLELEYKETCRQLASSNTHGETLEAQVSVFRRAKELEHHEDRLFLYFLRHSLSPSSIQSAVANGEIPNVPADVPESRRNQQVGLLAASDDNLYHYDEQQSLPIKLGGDGSSSPQELRVPHEVAQLVNRHFEELSTRADSQRAQIAQLNASIANRDQEIDRLTNCCKSMQEALDTLRTQHRDNENKLLLESSEKAAAQVRCDDAVRTVLLLKASLRLTLEENEKISRELDKQLTRIQVIDANEAMHANRHDDATHTIELRTNEIIQLRQVISTMESNERNLSDENNQLRDAARRLQEQIAVMRQRFEELSTDVSKRLQEQAQRVTSIEDYTMKLATTAVQAQMAEQEASRQAQMLIDQMRVESNETQKRTAAVVNDMNSLPSISLPAHDQTIRPIFVQTTIETENDDDNQQRNGNNNAGSRSPKRSKEQQEPKYGPLSPAGRLGTALAESVAYGDNFHRQHEREEQQQRAANSQNNSNNGRQTLNVADLADEGKLQQLLSPFAGKAGIAVPQQQQKPVDPAEQLAQQIRATLAMDADAKNKLEAAIAHANATMGQA